MLYFQPPPYTRYDVSFSLFGIPVRIHPIFWLLVLLFATSSRGILQILISALVICFSLLLHEMGHAWAMRLFGRDAEIILYYGGGLTLERNQAWGKTWASVSLTRRQEILISLSGALAGFSLVALIILLVQLTGGSVALTWLFGFLPFPVLQTSAGSLINTFISSLVWINLFWGGINLMPVLPLDGGHIAQQLFLMADPRHGQRKAFQLSFLSGVVLAVIGLVLFSSLFMALIFGMLAYQSYRAMR